MNRFTLAIALISLASFVTADEHELMGQSPLGGGPITVTPLHGPIDTRGIEFKATGPFLEQGESAAPYAFFLTNGGKPGAGLDQITAGALANVAIAGPTVLEGYIVSAEAKNGDITLTWGRGAVPTASLFCVGPCIPEPSTGILASFALLGLLGFRRRR